MDLIEQRKNATAVRLERIVGRLAAVQNMVAGKACVYATGSFGRLDAGNNSDLDLVIVGASAQDPDNPSAALSQLSNINAILLKAALINAAYDENLPPFDSDGKYLKHYSASYFVKTLGTPDDDASNAFTSRLLMLLESRPILGRDTYEELVRSVINAYWRDFYDHQDDFIPAFLSNDILRLWRTFCVNYEARTNSETPENKIKRRIKNYKLKYSRLLTCFSSLIYMLSVYVRNGTVTPDDAQKMVLLTPIERLDETANFGAQTAIGNIKVQYAEFLDFTNRSGHELRQLFSDDWVAKSEMEKARNFGGAVYAALQDIGRDSPFLKLIFV